MPSAYIPHCALPTGQQGSFGAGDTVQGKGGFRRDCHSCETGNQKGATDKNKS